MDLLLFGESPVVERASDPVMIEWKNFGILYAERKVRNIINLVFVVLILFISIFVLSASKSIMSNILNHPQLQEMNCSEQPSDSEVAIDMMLLQGQQKNLVQCFCQSKIQDGNSIAKVMNIDFADFKYFNRHKFQQFLKIKGVKDESKFDFTSNMPDDLRYPCRKYFEQYEKQYALKFFISFILVLINQIVSTIFNKIVPFEK